MHGYIDNPCIWRLREIQNTWQLSWKTPQQKVAVVCVFSFHCDDQKPGAHALMVKKDFYPEIRVK